MSLDFGRNDKLWCRKRENEKTGQTQNLHELSHDPRRWRVALWFPDPEGNTG